MNRPVVRIHQWVPLDAIALVCQEALRAEAQAIGYIVAATCSERGPGTWDDRPQFQQLLADLNACDTIIAEHLDRITRLPLDKVVALMGLVCAKRAWISIPGLSELSHSGVGPAPIVREAMQAMLLKPLANRSAAEWRGAPSRLTPRRTRPAFTDQSNPRAGKPASR